MSITYVENIVSNYKYLLLYLAGFAWLGLLKITTNLQKSNHVLHKI